MSLQLAQLINLSILILFDLYDNFLKILKELKIFANLSFLFIPYPSNISSKPKPDRQTLYLF